MGSKTRLSSYCTKRANNGVNLVTSRKIITRLARPIEMFVKYPQKLHLSCENYPRKESELCQKRPRKPLNLAVDEVYKTC